MSSLTNINIAVEAICDLPLEGLRKRPRRSVSVRVTELAPPQSLGDGLRQGHECETPLPATFHFSDGAQDATGHVTFSRGEFFTVRLEARSKWKLRFDVMVEGPRLTTLGYVEINVGDCARETSWNLLLQDPNTHNPVHGTDFVEGECAHGPRGQLLNVRRPSFLKLRTCKENCVDDPDTVKARRNPSQEDNEEDFAPGCSEERPKIAGRTRVMMITRGTRGDVQPFVALARGLIKPPYNCEVVIVAELFWKDFIKSNRVGLPEGTLLFRPIGGDTNFQTRTYVSQLATWHGQHHDSIQTLVMSNQETNFFPSEGCVYQWTVEENPDFIVFGHTMVHIAMIVSEKLNIPIVGFLLQPSRRIEERDELMNAVDQLKQPVRHAIDSPEFTAVLMQMMEQIGVMQGLTVNKLRRSRGLLPFPLDINESMRQYDECEKHGVPLITPINPLVIDKARVDEFKHVTFTDFIFLRLGGDESLDPKITAFIQQARARSRPVVAMTFSSMPVGENAMLKMALAVCTSQDLRRPIAGSAGAAVGATNSSPPAPQVEKTWSSSPRWPVRHVRSHEMGVRIPTDGAEAAVGPAMIVFLGGQEHDPASPEMLEQAEELEQQGRLLVMRKGQPFGILFSKLDAVIGQGGLGVTSEALRAGIPIVTSGILLLDQRWWAARVHEMGCGSKAVRIQRLMTRLDPDGSRLIVMLLRKALGMVPAETPKSSAVIEQSKEDSPNTWPACAEEVGRRLRESSAEDPDGIARNVRAVYEGGMQKRACIIDGFHDEQAACGFGGAICRQFRCCARCAWSSLRWMLLKECPALAFFLIVCFSECLRCGPCRRSCSRYKRRLDKRRLRKSHGSGFTIESDWQDEWLSEDEASDRLQSDISSDDDSDTSGSDQPSRRSSTMGRLLKSVSRLSLGRSG